MSFATQERVLFDLLFDKSLRESFQEISIEALLKYDLDEDELADFKVVRADALALDASMRVYLILTQICRRFPLTFSLVSSLDNGLELLQDMVNLETMQCHAMERATAFGKQLRKNLQVYTGDAIADQEIILAILDAELGMEWSSVVLKHALLEGKFTKTPSDTATELSEDWSNKSVNFAAYVSMSILPQSYSILKDALCPCEDVALWAHLSKTQITVAEQNGILSTEAEKKLFVARAYISQFSIFEPTLAYKTIELSEGFYPLLAHVDGVNSVATILAQLQKIGAPETVLDSVRLGFEHLLMYGMLEFV